MNFCVQHDDNGNITGTWGPSEANPPAVFNQLVFPEWVDTTGKRVNIAMQCLEDCPELARQKNNYEVAAQLAELDIKKQRALFDGLRNNDWTWFDKHEAAAVELRKKFK